MFPLPNVGPAASDAAALSGYLKPEFPGYRSGQRFISNVGYVGGTGNSATHNAGNIYFHPIEILKNVTVDRIGFYIQGGIAGTALRLSLYTAKGVFVKDLGVMTPNSGAFSEMTISETLAKGYHLIGIHANSESPLIQGFLNAAPTTSTSGSVTATDANFFIEANTANVSGFAPFSGAVLSYASGSPATVPALTVAIGSNVKPYIFLRAAP